MINDLVRIISRLTQRERMIVFVGIVLGALMIFYAVMVEPMVKRRTELLADIQENIALRAWLDARVVDVQAFSTVPNDRTDWRREPVGISGIEQSLADASLRLNITRLSDMPSGAVELSFGDVSFLNLVEWMEAVQQHSGYFVARFSLARQNAPDKVNAEVMLEPFP